MHSYPKSHRLRSKQDFESVYQESFRMVGDSFLLRIRPHRACPRLGVLVSKKFGGAPHRNAVRRILRELFRLNPPALPVDVHFSQIRPFTKWYKTKKELRKFFTVLGDRDFLSVLPAAGEMPLKNYRPSAPLGFLSRAAIKLITAYKRGLSPGLPSACRYLPTCSAYALEAFRMYGFFRGLWLSLGRILRCHPLGGSGYDPVPGTLPPPPQKPRTKIKRK